MGLRLMLFFYFFFDLFLGLDDDLRGRKSVVHEWFTRNCGRGRNKIVYIEKSLRQAKGGVTTLLFYVLPPLFYIIDVEAE